MNTKPQSACCFASITFLLFTCAIAVAAELAPPPMAVAPFDAETAKQHQQAWAKYLGVPVEWTNSIGMRFTLIPPGEFMMGSSQEEFENMVERFRGLKGILEAEQPQHRVRLTRAFYLALTEVTQGEYERVMGDTLGRFKTAPTYAMERVTWDDAVAYCQKLGELPEEQASRAAYRLPTEAEWEYACRAGTTTWCSGADEEAAFQEQAWIVAGGTRNAVSFNIRIGQTRDHVGQKPPNAWGLYDLHGNVWEWCSDWYDRDYYADSPLDDPQGPARTSRRVCRGGSWFRDDASFCRASFRFGLPPRAAQGFRLARTVSLRSVPAEIRSDKEKKEDSNDENDDNGQEPW
jgi:formylglycine-generating enzyme required for sulfatase activity